MSRDGRPVAKGVSGTVKWFDVQKGFGFISRGDNGDDCFAHRTAIAAKNPNHYDASLAEGEEVEFDVIQGQKGMEASNITGPRGGPVRGNDQAASGGGGGYGGGRSFGGGGRGGGGYGGGGYGGGGGGGYGGGRGGGRGGYGGGGRGGGGGGGDGCFKCGEQGHFARECPNSGGGGGGRY